MTIEIVTPTTETWPKQQLEANAVDYLIFALGRLKANGEVSHECEAIHNNIVETLKKRK